VVNSTFNHCHYEDDTTIIRMKKSKGFVFMYGLLGKLLILMGTLLHFLNVTQNACISNGQESMAVQK